MLTFLRKIRKSLMQKNKFTTYLIYALGEIVLVVIGILIAIQINNAYQNSKDKKEEERLIAQLQDEFLKNREQLIFINEKNKKVLDALYRVLDRIPINVKTVDLDSLASDLNETADFNTYDPSEATIGELQNNSFDIISDSRLRFLLLSWEAVKKDLKDDELYSIEYAKDYNQYMQKHISIDFGLRKPNMDLSFLNSTEFENWVRVRQIYSNDLVDSEDYQDLLTLIDEIIELTSTGTEELL